MISCCGVALPASPVPGSSLGRTQNQHLALAHPPPTWGPAGEESSDGESDEEEDEDKKPQMELAMMPHYGGINRVRVSSLNPPLLGGQMAERLGNRAINQKVAGSIPGCYR